MGSDEYNFSLLNSYFENILKSQKFKLSIVVPRTSPGTIAASEIVNQTKFDR